MLGSSKIHSERVSKNTQSSNQSHSWTLRKITKRLLPNTSLIAASLTLSPLAATAQDPNHAGILEPVLTALTGTEVRIPNTDQAEGKTLLNLASRVRVRKARDSLSLPPC